MHNANVCIVFIVWQDNLHPFHFEPYNTEDIFSSVYGGNAWKESDVQ